MGNMPSLPRSALPLVTGRGVHTFVELGCREGGHHADEGDGCKGDLNEPHLEFVGCAGGFICDTSCDEEWKLFGWLGLDG